MRSVDPWACRGGAIIAAFNPSRFEKREAERWLAEHVGDYDTVQKRIQTMAIVLGREVNIAKSLGFKNVYSRDRSLRQAVESKDDRGFCYIGDVVYDPTPEGSGMEVWYHFEKRAFRGRRK